MKKTTKKAPAKKAEKLITDTLGSLDKLLDTLTLKMKHDEESVIKLIFGHLGFLIGYIDGEKELTKITDDIKKEVKAYLLLEKKETKKAAPKKKIAKKK